MIEKDFEKICKEIIWIDNPIWSIKFYLLFVGRNTKNMTTVFSMDFYLSDVSVGNRLAYFDKCDRKFDAASVQ